jgi:hypothetical protein
MCDAPAALTTGSMLLAAPVPVWLLGPGAGSNPAGSDMLYAQYTHIVESILPAHLAALPPSTMAWAAKVGNELSNDGGSSSGGGSGGGSGGSSGSGGSGGGKRTLSAADAPAVVADVTAVLNTRARFDAGVAAILRGRKHVLDEKICPRGPA